MGCDAKFAPARATGGAIAGSPGPFLYSDCSEDLTIYEIRGLKELQLLAMDIVNLQDKIENIIDNNKERFITN